MTRLRPSATAAFQIVLAAILCSGQMLLAQRAKEPSPENPELSMFVGFWHGSFNRTNWGMTYPMIMQIQPVKAREVLVRVDWPLFRSRTTGPGITTANCVSWAELEVESGDGGETSGHMMFGRYVAVVSTNNELKGKYYSESSLDEVSSFTLTKTDPEALKAFRARNAKALERINAASRNLEFLHPAWRRIMPSALRWLNETLGYDFWMIDDGVLPDLQYAEELASALEKKENLFKRKPGSEIPLWLDGGGDPSINIVSYRISFPKDFPDSNEKYPLLIELHGGGEHRRRSHFVELQSSRETPFIILKPLSYWAWQPKALNVMFAELKSIVPVDEDRVYLRGGSMGGEGTYRWAIENPELFAAISPFCGHADVSWAPRLKNVPTWIFHGEKDQAVPFWFSATMVHALQACGANVRYTFFPEGQHKIGDLIDYKTLEEWFLKHKRSAALNHPDPVDDLKLDQNGIGQKNLIALPQQRFASIQFERGRRSDSRLYWPFRSQGLLQQFLPLDSEPEGKYFNMMLAIPKDLEINELPENVKITEVPPCRALSFAVVWRDNAKVEEAIASAVKELKERGETPTGEIRRTNGTRAGGKLIQRIDILLR